MLETKLDVKGGESGNILQAAGSGGNKVIVRMLGSIDEAYLDGASRPHRISTEHQFLTGSGDINIHKFLQINIPEQRSGFRWNWSD